MAQARGLALLATLIALLATVLDGSSSATSPTPAHADASLGHPGAGSGQLALREARFTGSPGCPMVVSTSTYVNPLADATVRPERIDQGVDYAGAGPLLAIGAARVTHVATDGTGWPGAFIEYRLLTGPDAGCSIYFAEGVSPVPGLRAGVTVSAGQVIGSIIPHYPTGFEVGWGAGTGTKTYVGVTGQWSVTDDDANIATGPGKAFSALIGALGGPPGKDES